MSLGQTRHHVAGVGPTHANGDHAEATRVGRMRIGADHQATGKGVVLDHHLVNDARAGLPEANAVFIRDGSQKVVDLPVFAFGVI